MPEHFLNDSALPHLLVVTKPVEERADFLTSFLPVTDAKTPLVWLKNGAGVIGAGETLRLKFSGETRFSEASRVWKELSAKADIHDLVQAPGTGLMGFATFSFDADSDRESVIIVPKIIVGKMHGKTWVTEITKISESTESTDLLIDPDAGSPIGAAPVASFIEPTGEANAYREGVQEASKRIAAGEAEKIVLARRLISPIPEGDLRFALRSLADKYTDCWTFAVDGMIGSSPETLIRSVAGSVTARVLAGTRKRALDEARDEQMRQELIDSSKEQFEHRLAVDSLVDTLTPFVNGLQTEDAPHILKLPNVWHLATDVAAELAAGASVLELAGAVHPTAAVAGTPTSTAIKAIAELEPFDRERYAGAVGWIDGDGDGDFAIALRCAQVNGEGADRTITAYAGGGLVAGSDPWHELTETVAKFRPIIEAFS